MNEHYYTAEPSSAHRLRRVHAEVLGQECVFDTDSGVFSKEGLDTGSRVLLEAASDASGRVLDLGCGWGMLGIALKKKEPSIDLVMTDINRRAVELTRGNLLLNGLTAEVLQGDGFEKVEGRFDLILTNPPIRAGKQVIYRLFLQAADYLKENGMLMLVIRKQQGAPSALKYLRTIYREAEVARREAGYWVIRCTGLKEVQCE